MTILVLETSTERGIVAAFKEGNSLFEEQLPFGLQSSHHLLPMVQKKIKEGIFQQRELTAIIVGIGPGSYTGIRVGATIAQCLAFSLEIPVIGIGTLEAFLPEKEGAFAVLIDAKIGGVYMQKGVLSNGKTHMTSDPQAYPLPEAVTLLQDVPLLVTPNAGKIAPKLEALMPHKKWHWQESYPSAHQMLQVGMQQKKLQNSTSDHTRLELLYLRKTQAEMERG